MAVTSPQAAAAGAAESLTALLLALGATALPVLVHPAGQPFAVALCAACAVCIARAVPNIVPAALLCAFLFQNAVVAMVSSAIEGPSDFNAIRGYNFVLTAAIWLSLFVPYWLRARVDRPPSFPLMRGTTILLVLVGAYFLLGAASDFRSAAAYLRNLAVPIFAFQSCLIVAERARADLSRQLPALGLMLLAYGYAELLARPTLFQVVDAHGFFAHNLRQMIESGEFVRELRETGRVVRGWDDLFTFDLFNTPLLAELGIRVYRLQGPNFAPISFAYALAVLGLWRLAAGRPLAYAAALPLLVVIGSKGATVMALLCGLAIAAFAMTRSRAVLPALAVTLALYAGAAVVLGLASGDYHVIGLIGGLKGFLQNPIGHGLGIGGNLSMNMTRIDWGRAQALGSTDVAVESAVGVVLYQMGVAGIAVCLTPILLARRAWDVAVRTGRTDLAAVAVMLLVLLTNGLLQEEALFAPLAYGTVMLLAGLAFGSALARADIDTIPRSAAVGRGTQARFGTAGAR